MKGAFIATWDFIKGYIEPAIKELVNAALGPLSEMAKTAGNAFNNTLKPAFDTVTSFINSAMKPAFDSLSGVINGVSGAISGIGDAISGAIGWLNRLADKIRSMPSMPSVSVPGFASGTNFAPGGMALVGERGPELVTLPRGSRVNTASETANMLGNSGGTTQIFNLAYNTQQSSGSVRMDIGMLQTLTKGV